jgi:hypothetical protein
LPNKPPTFSHFILKFAIIFIVSLVFISTSFAPNNNAVFDEKYRLISYLGKVETTCPSQDKKTAVLLVIGQSNSANHGKERMHTSYPNKVFNYFNGKCYAASSPLLGASGEDGEFITPLADYLISKGIYEKVLIIASGINGSEIKRWAKGGELNKLLSSILEDVRSKYQITEVIWHQGESDFIYKTAETDYKSSFQSLVNTLRPNTGKMPPIYYAVTTRCDGDNWYPNNPIAKVQRTLASKDNIFLAVDTDTLVLPEDRMNPGLCHFQAAGQMKTAYAFAHAIEKNKPFYKDN